MAVHYVLACTAISNVHNLHVSAVDELTDTLREEGNKLDQYELLGAVCNLRSFKLVWSMS